MFRLAARIIGTRSSRLLRRMARTVQRINGLEAGLKEIDDAGLRARTDQFRQRLQAGENLEQLLPEAFAVVREASRRVLGLRHFDVQLMGGIALHRGYVAEMRTGEGKTLVATLPIYLHALEGKGVHLVTVNDYLARRDAGWMGPLYRALGLRVGVVVPGLGIEQKRRAYAADISYGTNNEFGFDYLRDNMVYEPAQRVQRGLHYAIVDEVDSILIDEARTPLVISGHSEQGSQLYEAINVLIPKLRPQDSAGGGHYLVDEKQRQVELSEEGHQYVEQLLAERKLLKSGESLYTASKLGLVHFVNSALRAHVLFRRDVDYIVHEGQVVLIDEHTGRTMPGRRLSEGLHQALEAKERVPVQRESRTMASITFQNFFRLYDTLAGMTGTADTEARELHQIYGLEVVVVPTNQPMVREDLCDLVFISRQEKLDALIEDIRALRDKASSPLLIGTASIESSEEVSLRLQQADIPHKVLNAKRHREEAQIIAQAGRPGAVTIATNMAGRGTDIVLGGNLEAELAQLGEDAPPDEVEQLKEDWKRRHEQVVEAGGLHILGTERHESRRIDNQLRGRSGRQGDPGVSRFYVSLEDDLMRIFVTERVQRMMRSLGVQTGEAIEHGMVSRAIERAQRKVEERNFDIRKQLLEYDDIANEQRQVIYGQRDELLASDDVSVMVKAMFRDVAAESFARYIPAQSLPEDWDLEGLEQQLEVEFGHRFPVRAWYEQQQETDEERLTQRIVEESWSSYWRDGRDQPEMRLVEKQVLLEVLDSLWREHLVHLDHLRQGIHLRAYAQRNPKQEYRREAFDLFREMLDSIRYQAVRLLSRVTIQDSPEPELEAASEQKQLAAAPAVAPPQAPVASGRLAGGRAVAQGLRKVGRNEPCPCGSGRKYKHCCGGVARQHSSA